MSAPPLRPRRMFAELPVDGAIERHHTGSRHMTSFGTCPASRWRRARAIANNHDVVDANSIYAQDQIGLTSWLQVVAGMRAQAFDINYHNNRGDTTFNRLALTAAVYHLDRTNTRAPDPVDPVDPTLVVQTGKSRATGTELCAYGTLTSRWQIAGTYTNQSAKIRSLTTAAAPGATVAIVPHTVASLWNKVDVTRRFGLGLGAYRQSDMSASVGNKVTLRGYSRVDGAAFFTPIDKLRVQVNVDNMFDKKYFLTADNDNNVTPGAPGAPRVARVSLTTAF